MSAVVLAGCPFDPRDAPPPAAPTACDSTLLDNTPDNIRRKIVRAFECRRADTYGECLSVTFTYVPDNAAEASAPPGFFFGWTTAKEVSSMSEAFTQANAIRMRILRFQDTGELSGDELRYDVQYELRLALAGGDTLRYGGCARWDFNGVQALEARLNQWTDLASFGPAGCTPDSAAVGDQTSGFMRVTFPPPQGVQ